MDSSGYHFIINKFLSIIKKINRIHYFRKKISINKNEKIKQKHSDCMNMGRAKILLKDLSDLKEIDNNH